MRTEVEAIAAHLVRVTHHIDRKRWTELRALFADEVDVDYTALNGGSPARQRADDLIGGWHEHLAAVTTQHLLGPIDVELDGASAHASCHVRAFHFVKDKPGGEQWIVMGHYVFRLEKADVWAITAMKLEVFHQLGNSKLLA